MSKFDKQYERALQATAGTHTKSTSLVRRIRPRFHIATQHGYIEGSFATKGEARKALTDIVRNEARECRRKFGRCSVVGSVKSDSVEIKIGGRQGYNLWDRYVINSE